MKNTLRTLLAAALLSMSLGTVAFADKAKDDGESLMAIMEKLADIIDKDKADCDKMAADVGKFLDDNAAEIKRLKEAGKTKTEDERKALRAKYKDRMEAAKKKMMDGGKKCGDNEKFRAAMERMK